MKRRCEQNTCEQSRDTYGKWHDQIKNMVDTIQSGGKMNMEDVKYRQGRSRKQMEGNYKLTFFSLIGLITIFCYG